MLVIVSKIDVGFIIFDHKHGDKWIITVNQKGGKFHFHAPIGALVYLLEPFELVPVLLEDKLLDEVPVVVVNLQNDKMYFMHTLHHLHNFVMTQKMRSLISLRYILVLIH